MPEGTKSPQMHSPLLQNGYAPRHARCAMEPIKSTSSNPDIE
eukprot:CAMPEP_0117572742 /NCGR_PEP_ID=MMETSP0784-20121206/60523_1 /TAXON_ID=39447 /ORGANISM="" /LENGTH=41 /DNA_ID= /DNA_START= /DNA_END= /DNA_ORIENTATION=